MDKSNNIKESTVDGNAAKGEEAAAIQAALEAELAEIVKRARQGDRGVLPALRKALDDHPEYFKRAGDVAMMAQESWLTTAVGSDLFARETIERKLVTMRSDLAGSHPSPVESWIVDRIVACWLQMHHADMLFNDNQSQCEAIRKELMKRQESCQRRYFDAVKQLAQVRKLLQPSANAKKTKVVDPLASQSTDAARAPAGRDPKLAVFRGASAEGACEDPLTRLGREAKATAASTVLEFPRISKEHEADALVNGVGILN